MMESPVGEDDETTLLRQSAKFLKELGEAFEHVESVSNERELDAILRKVHATPLLTQIDANNSKIEPYQEDPQLLDSALSTFIPTLSSKFLAHLQDPIVLKHVSRILYTFAKVRGEKVIVGLLNNEPRWIEPLLEVVTAERNEDDLTWEDVACLWGPLRFMR